MLTGEPPELSGEATAKILVEFLAARGKTCGLVGPRELATGLGVYLDYLDTHATELGAIRVGSGPKPPYPFDLDGARRALDARAQRSPRQRQARGSIEPTETSRYVALVRAAPPPRG